MKAKPSENGFRAKGRGIFRRRIRRHDPLLVVNMSIFNFSNGWDRTFSKNQSARFYA
jgi:hypothetical protein